MKSKSKVLLGMSGGLDSTYSAVLLKEKGYEVIGCAVKMHGYTDVSAAEKSARELGISFTVIDGTELFKKEVADCFAMEYSIGRTPNPCVRCNPKVKIALLTDYAEKNGIEKVATGHYADIGFEGGRYFVRADTVSGKDQSYVLCGLTQKQLSMLVFPMCGVIKENARESAGNMHLSSSTAKDSQDNCFIPDGDYVSFVKAKAGREFPEGDFIDGDGNVLGRHNGIVNYTVGQRRGLNIALGERMYVSEINAENNTVTLLPAKDKQAGEIFISELNYMKLPVDTKEFYGSVRVRYSAKPQPCRVETDGLSAKITMNEKITGVLPAPGQSAVIYDGNDIMLSGTIYKTR